MIRVSLCEILDDEWSWCLFQAFQVTYLVMCLADCLAEVHLVEVHLVVVLLVAYLVVEGDGMVVIEKGKCKTLLSH